MIRGSALNGMISRDPSGWFDVTADWTDTRVLRFESTPAGFVNVWFYGDLTYATPYIWVGNTSGTNQLGMEVYDGVSFFTSATVNIGAATNTTVAIRYTASTTSVAFMVNGVLIDTLVVDLGPLAGITEEHGLNDGGSEDLVAMGYWRRWQAALTTPQIAADRWTLYPALTTNLLANSPLEVIAVLTDTEGHDWTAGGTLATALPFNTTCATAAVVPAVPYTLAQNRCGATDLWATYTTPGGPSTTIYLGMTPNAGTRTAQFLIGACGSQSTLISDGTDHLYHTSVLPATPYWLRMTDFVGVSAVAWRVSSTVTFETLNGPLTWYPDLSNGVTVTATSS